MSKSPIEKRAGQTVEEMTDQLMGSTEQNRLYSTRKGNYKEISDQLKSEALSAAIDQQLELLALAKKRGRVNLDDLDEVENAAVLYMRSCREAGTYPTITAFAASCGYHRQTVYRHMQKDTKAAEYLKSLTSSWASLLEQMGLARQCSESVAIFLLKNSGQGMADRAEIDIGPKTTSQFGEGLSPEELQRKYIEDAYGYIPDQE